MVDYSSPGGYQSFNLDICATYHKGQGQGSTLDAIIANIRTTPKCILRLTLGLRAFVTSASVRIETFIQDSLEVANGVVPIAEERWSVSTLSVWSLLV